MRYFFLLIIIYSLSGYSQTSSDTIFFDQKWKPCSHDNYTYYRLSKLKNGLYFVTDYFKDGKPQMTGSYADAETQVKNGHFISYFRSGYKKSEVDWQNNVKQGTWHYYQDSTGKLERTVTYLNGKKHGELMYNFLNGIVYKAIYTNSKLISSTSSLSHIEMPAPKPVIIPGVGSAGDQDIFNQSLLDNFKSMVPDSLKDLHCDVVINYQQDENGKPVNIQRDTDAYPYHAAAVIKTIQENNHWEVYNYHTLRSNVYYGVRFPEMGMEIVVQKPDSAQKKDGFILHVPPLVYQKIPDISDTLQAFMKQMLALGSLAKDTNIHAYAIVRFVTDPSGIVGIINISNIHDARISEFLTSAVKSYTHWEDFAGHMSHLITAYTFTVSFPKMRVSCLTENFE